MRERLTILVIVGTRTDEHSLRSQVGMDLSQIAVTKKEEEEDSRVKHIAPAT